MLSTQTDTARDARRLADALLDFCRSGSRELTTNPLAAHGDQVILALTGTSAPADQRSRVALAHWIVGAVNEQITTLSEMDRRIAEVALITRKEMFGMNITERVNASRRFSMDQYQRHRRRVVDVVATGLIAAFQARSQHGLGADWLPPCDRRSLVSCAPLPPTIFLAGLDNSSSLDDMAIELGLALAQVPFDVNCVSMASRVCMKVAYVRAEQSVIMNTYTPERYTLVRRTGSRRPQPLNHHLGRTICLSATLQEARRHIIDSCHLVLVVAGDDGTTEETEIAHRRGVPVVPLATTGGAARKRWNTDSYLWRDSTAIQSLYHDLANPDSTVAVHAASGLLTHRLADQFG